mgnify:CR=1 FL=1
MTVKLEGTIRRYIGLSTDAKPVLGYQSDGSTITALDMPAGSSFLETDTGRIYRWDGSSAWTLPVVSGSDELYVLQALLIEVTQLRQVVELTIGA